jgi:hypothetical protein
MVLPWKVEAREQYVTGFCGVPWFSYVLLATTMFTEGMSPSSSSKLLRKDNGGSEFAEVAPSENHLCFLCHNISRSHRSAFFTSFK